MIDIEVVTGEMGTRSNRMFREEGFFNTLRVMSKWMFDPRIRRHMNAIFQFFKDNADYIAYGIYTGRKPQEGELK